jgi:glycosyltransferase involved in cell wall biosynthesis
MAALQHGLPIVATDGPLTDEIFRRADPVLQLVPVARKDRFVDATLRLTMSPDERRTVGRFARQLYDQQFDWPVIASRLRDYLRSRELPIA